MISPLKTVAAAGRKLIRPVAAAARKVKVRRPEIYVIGGVAFILTAFGLVAYESTKAPDIMASGKEKLDELKHMKEELESEEELKVPVTVKDEDGNEIYVNQFRLMDTEERAVRLTQVNKDIHQAKVESVWSMAKLYIPSVVLLLIGLGFDLRGVQILRKENVALAATVSGLERFINFYRGNVIADQGKDKDLQYARGIIGEKEVSRVITDANGKEVTEKEKIPVLNGHRDGNPWRFEYSPTFFRSATGDPDHDIMHIKNVQDYFDHMYGGRKKHGKISYYEVLEYLDPIWEAIDATGDVETFCREYGWGHDERGDDFIDLGVYRAINDAAIKGIGDCVWIEANCDGRLKDLKNKNKEKYLL